MATTPVTAMVLAGGRGSRLHPLTANHAKPALPLADGRRIVDFVLSNLVNSGIGAIHVLAQYKPSSLVAHISKIWAPAVRGPGRFVEVVLPDADRGPFLGTADAVYKSLRLVKRQRPGLVAIFAGDHVYRMNVGQMIDFHIRSRAAVSVAAVPVPMREASSFGVIVAGRDGRIEHFEEKPQRPTPIPTNAACAYASMGNYLFDVDVLTELLEHAHVRGETDFGHHILPRAIRAHRVLAYDFASNRVPGLHPCEEPNYWRDVGTLSAYRQVQQDIAGAEPRFALNNRHWPVHPETSDPATTLIASSQHRGARSDNGISRGSIAATELFARATAAGADGQARTQESAYRGAGRG